MPNNFYIIIPSRYGSSRLPGKPLLVIKDKTLIQHVFEAASKTQAKKILIATDNDEIKSNVESFGGTAVLTSSEHQSGTDRISEVIEKLNFDDERIIVNLQGDEYGLSPSLINQLVLNFSKNIHCDVATLCEHITDIDDYLNPNIVKVVFNKDNEAIFFSRSPIPSNTTKNIPKNIFKHIGLYAYRVGYLKKFTKFESCELEKTEQLEQLRILYNGGKIHVGVVDSCNSIGVDTKEDFEDACLRAMSE